MKLVYLGLVVFAASIAVFFAHDFGKFYKKITAIPGMRLILPMVLASFFLISCESLVLHSLQNVQKVLHVFVDLLQKLLPFQTGSQLIAATLLLTTCTILPVVMADFIIHRKFAGYNWLNGTLIWLSLAILFTVNFTDAPTNALY